MKEGNETRRGREWSCLYTEPWWRGGMKGLNQKHEQSVRKQNSVKSTGGRPNVRMGQPALTKIFCVTVSCYFWSSSNHIRVLDVTPESNLNKYYTWGLFLEADPHLDARVFIEAGGVRGKTKCGVMTMKHNWQWNSWMLTLDSHSHLFTGSGHVNNEYFCSFQVFSGDTATTTAAVFSHSDFNPPPQMSRCPPDMLDMKGRGEPLVSRLPATASCGRKENGSLDNVRRRTFDLVAWW